MIRTACVVHGRDGYRLQVVEVPLRILVVRRLFCEPLEWLTATTGHRICCRQPDWTWRIGWGKYRPGDPEYDSEYPDVLEHSLGGAMYHAFSRVVVGYGYCKEHVLHDVAITSEQVALYPEWREHLEEADQLDDDLPQIPDEPSRDAMRVTGKDFRNKDSVAL